MSLGGAGLGTFIGPAINVVLQRVKNTAAGAASGVFSTAQRLGGAVGVAVVGVVFYGALPSQAAATAGPAIYASAFQHALLYEIVVFTLTFLLVFALPRKARSAEADS